LLSSRRTVIAPIALLAAAFMLVTIPACGRKSAAATPQANAPSSSASTPAPPTAKGTTPAPVAPKVTLPQIAEADLLQPPAYDGFEPLPSFTYHHVDPKLKNNIAITPATFESQLKMLSNMGYHTVTARQVVEHQTKGTPLPDKPVMITFDDGC
jgi:hypothetical protein